MQLDPLSGSVYLFCNKGRKPLKAVWWDRTGFWLAQKRLERERYLDDWQLTPDNNACERGMRKHEGEQAVARDDITARG
jgi:transposase